jgi:pyruvate kinase
LSAETAIGEYPVQAVAMMDRIIRRAELDPGTYSEVPRFQEKDDHGYVVARAAKQIVESDEAIKAVVCFTRSGRTARLMSKVHPGAPVIAFSPKAETCRRLGLARGVETILAPQVETSEDLLRMTDRMLLGSGRLQPGDEIVVVASLPVRTSGATNFLKLHRMGESGDYA